LLKTILIQFHKEKKKRGNLSCFQHFSVQAWLRAGQILKHLKKKAAFSDSLSHIQTGMRQVKAG
jgi:hypothetical protein